MTGSVPGDEELLGIGFDIDQNSVQETNTAIQSIGTSLDDIIVKSNKLSAAAAQAGETLLRFDQLGGDLGDGIKSTFAQLETVTESFNQELFTMNDEFLKVLDATRTETEATNEQAKAAAALAKEWENVFQQQKGYGVEGGLQGPASPGYGVAGGDIGPAPLDATGGDGGVSIGSLFPLARAARGAGGLAGIAGADPGVAQAFTGIADIAFIAEGFRRFKEVLEGVNESIINSGGLIGTFAAGLDALEIPMAGMVAVLGPIAAVVAALVIVLEALNQKYQEQVKAVQAAQDEQLQAQKEYDTDLYTLTTTQAKDRLDKLRTDFNIAQADKNAAAENIVAQYAGYVPSNITDPNAIVKYLEALTTFPADDLSKKLFKAYDDAASSANNSTASVLKLEYGLEHHAFAANDVAEATDKAAKAEQALADARSKAEAVALQQTVSWNEQLAKLIATGTQSQLDNLIATLQGRKVGDQANIDFLTAKEGPRGELPLSDAESAQLKKYTDDLTQVNHQLDDLHSKVQPVIDARDAENNRIQTTTDALKSVVSAQAAYEKAVQTAENTLATQTADARTREKQAEEQYLQGSIQDTQQRLDIATKESRDEIKIKQDAYQQIVDLGTKLSEAEQKSSTELARQFQDDGIKANNQASKLRLDEQRQEQDDLTGHLQKLADIQKQQHNTDQQALLDRNFLQLAKNANANQQAVQQEDQRYIQQETTQRVHLQRALDDLSTSLQQEEDAQRLAYVRRFQDLQIGYNNDVLQHRQAEQRKLEATRSAEQQQLDDITTNEAYKIRLLQNNLNNELILYQQQENQRIQIAAATQSVIVANATRTLLGVVGQSTNTTGAGIRGFAEGGSFNAGEPFVFNEQGSSGSELVDMGGGTAFSANGAALVYPLQSGSVNPGSTSKTTSFAPVINIYDSNNPELTAKIVIQQVRAHLEDLLPS